MKVRLLAGAVALAMITAFGGIAAEGVTATAAHAATTTHSPHTGSITASVPCTSLAVADTCTLRVTSLQLANGVLTATGTVTNSAGTITAPFSGVPVSVTDPCTIVDLTLGPLHLNVLGLVVDLNQVHLTITAQNGPGNLLGNLLCAVAHLLDNTGNANGLQQLVNLVNGILANL